MSKMDDVMKQIRRWTRPWETGGSPMEVRRAVLEEVERRAVSLGEGKRVFPFNRVRVELRVEPDQRAAFEAIVQEGWHLESEIRERLRSQGVQVPPRIDTEITFLEDEQIDPGERRFTVTCERTDGAAVPMAGPADPAGTSPSTGRPELDLTVLQGKATETVYQLNAERIHLGRLREVIDVDGRIRRRNDVAFLEEGEVNTTVSREHARVVWDRESGGYWLRAEPGASATRIYRDGRTIEVSPHDRRGVRLQSGDEIFLGRACLKVGLRNLS
ncbi:MAG TPA: FHA domain-containing protein [Thermoanaerobaculia bacterium]|jgi:hypothetical protein|nr:FHA domain-containing protein [Thermoanaerobaculia bacterium]